MSTRTAVRLKDVTTYVNRGVAPSYVDEPTGWIAFNQKCVRPDGSIAAELGRPMADPGPAGRTTVLRAGDVCVNSTGRGTLGRAGFVDEDTASLRNLVADSHVTVLRSDPAVLEPRYLWYLLGNDRFYEYANTCLAVGSTNQTELGREALRTLRLQLPGLEEQQRIVEYLDAETTHIDDLIAEQARLRSLLEEHREAVIDSAIWDFGTIHTVRLGRLTPVDRPIMYGIVLPGPNVEEGVLLVKGGDVKRDRLTPARLNRTTPEIEAPYARARLRPNDVVYAIRGSIGDAEIVPPNLDGANITQDVARVAPGPGVDPQWLLFALKSRRFFAQMDAEARGATIRGINIWSLKRGTVPVVDLAQQQRVAKRLQALDTEMDQVRSEMGRQIALLQEHRQALITAAVTGGLEAVGMVV